MFKKSHTVAATAVRSLAEADGTYADAKALVVRLRASLAKLDAEESELLNRLANRPAAPEVTGRVAELLGDVDPDDKAAPDGFSARLKAISAERVDLRAAVDIATQRLTTARFGASKAICDEVRPVYADKVKALATALVAAHQAHVDLLALISDLNAEDIAWTGSMVPLQADRILGHQSGRVAVWLKEATDSGFVSKSEIPKELLV